MSFNNPLPKTNNYVFGRGVCYFAEFDENGNPKGERDLGNCPGLTLTVTTQNFEHFSSRSGLAKKDLDVTLSVAFGSKVEVEDMSAENLALIVAGSADTVTQDAGSVTNERIYNAQGGREYQLGATSSNPTGVRGVTAVTVDLYELVNAAARVNGATYAKGDYYQSQGKAYIVSVAGVAAGAPPAFDQSEIGADTTDGTATVLYLGHAGSSADYVADTDYTISAESARVAVIEDGTIAQVADVVFGVTGGYPSLNANYTTDANTRTQIQSSGAGSVTGQFRFISDNAEGDNRDLFLPSCNLKVSGDVPLITSNALQKVTFDLGVNEKDTDTAQVFIDGRVVAG